MPQNAFVDLLVALELFEFQFLLRNGERIGFDGKIALHSRLAERRRTYARRTLTTGRVAPPTVLVDNEISQRSTVVEVRAPDSIGVLYKITHAIAELDLDIHSAKVQTLGDEVVDSFYVRDRSGAKVVDPDPLRELERAILHALSD